MTHLSHTAINHLVMPIHKAALVTRKPQYSLSLFDRFTEAARRKMDLTTITFGGVVAEPVLEEWRAERIFSHFSATFER